MIYVDYPKSYPGKRKRYSHMMAEDLNELHKFAEMIGVKRCWFHKDHYDINTEKFHEAIISGAQLVHSRDLLKFRKK